MECAESLTAAGLGCDSGCQEISKFTIITDVFGKKLKKNNPLSKSLRILANRIFNPYRGTTFASHIAMTERLHMTHYGVYMDIACFRITVMFALQHPFLME